MYSARADSVSDGKRQHAACRASPGETVPRAVTVAVCDNARPPRRRCGGDPHPPGATVTAAHRMIWISLLCKPALSPRRRSVPACQLAQPAAAAQPDTKANSEYQPKQKVNGVILICPQARLHVQ